ncbi:GMC oxidoreductase [Roseomonas sp. OT10]|uniref:GMC family oxidoreductase n=1 Tax=Roseomonas cutis TaxID=2897332 RepID=UPI001E29E5D6|nr:GMC family oxidoreductase [Roseomonas sp. OT10]UFN47904.1 GMC oxidoreductase [Roseomonas sp. OT10]
MTLSAPLALTRGEARTLATLLRRIWPERGAMPDAVGLGALDFLDRTLAGAERAALDLYREGVPALNRAARALYGSPVEGLEDRQVDDLLGRLAAGDVPGMRLPSAAEFWATLRRHAIEGLFSDPAHGGNRAAATWRFLGHPGVRLADMPAPGTSPLTLADLDDGPDEDEIAGFDPARGLDAPNPRADVVVVGLGGVGSLAAARLALLGMEVVGLEAGGWRPLASYRPDELTGAVYARASLGPKFNAEVPRWRETPQQATRPMPFSLGRMGNGVGGTIAHYGARLRRHHPHHFRMRSLVREMGLERRLEEDCTLADWPLSYDALEPWYEEMEQLVGVAGPDSHPFIPRRTGLPMPATRAPKVGLAFAQAATTLGYHPTAVPVGQNTLPWGGRPPMAYSPWGEGLGSRTRDRWMPTFDLLPRALATGRLDLRTRCRVLRVLTGADGRAAGVSYVGPDGREREQRAPTVILAAYTFETVRLLFLSGDTHRADGLGNTSAQLGRHFMTKQFPSVLGHVPGAAFDRHAGPGAQGIIVEDLLRPEAFAAEDGLVGGATLGVENQMLPIQIAREALPPGLPSFGPAWQDHMARWNERAVIRIQTDTLSYHGNVLDLDPLHRDRGGYGLPLVRVTFAVRRNEERLADWAMRRSRDMLRRMGAATSWDGPRFTGIGSCHDFGGARMGLDPRTSVVSDDMQVHDTPGLYVMGGATFPSCHGVNPTLTMWALAARACDRLAGLHRPGLPGGSCS